jgi:hypothetical protein
MALRTHVSFSVYSTRKEDLRKARHELRGLAGGSVYFYLSKAGAVTTATTSLPGDVGEEVQEWLATSELKYKIEVRDGHPDQSY